MLARFTPGFLWRQAGEPVVSCADAAAPQIAGHPWPEL